MPNSERDIIAHKDNREGVKTQLLMDHLINVANECGRIGRKIEAENLCFVLGLLHDLGKADRKFQDYIWSDKKVKVIHSGAGAKFLWETCAGNTESIFGKKALGKIEYYFMDVACYVIESHHGLFDAVGDEKENGKYISNIKLRRKYDEHEKYNYKIDVLGFAGDINEELEKQKLYSIEYYISEGYKEFEKISKKIINISKETCEKNSDSRIAMDFYIHALTRLLLSILKEADVSDSIGYLKKNDSKAIYGEEIWNEAVKSIENEYIKMKNNEKSKLEINKIRTTLADNAFKRALVDKTGVYNLQLPTGAGKTRLVLRYALNNANKNSKSRIFYITAFLSVLEQNAEEIKRIISDENMILEHHSNVVMDENNENQEYDDTIASMREILLDSWRSPMVLTTMVQFFNTLFKEKSSNIRRFSALIDSIIIMDEAQSIPTNVTYLSNLMSNFMTGIMNCTIIHCTATPPAFDATSLKYRLNYINKKGEKSNIVNMSESQKSIFDRFDVFDLSEKYIGLNGGVLKYDDLVEEVTERLESMNSALVVLNKRKSVREVYDKINEKLEKMGVKYSLYYLTTNMCPAHRLDVIKEIRNKLREKNNSEKIICVSSQLIEAGVDVDFKMVFRSLAGLDSLIQSAGRCNREGLILKGQFYIFELEGENDENMKYLPEIRKKQMVSKYVFEEMTKINFEKIDLYGFNSLFYQKLFAQSEDLAYLVRSNDVDSRKTLVDMLSINSGNNLLRQEDFENCLFQSFKTAAKSFEMISDVTEGVIVPYGDGMKLIKELYDAIGEYDFVNVKKLLKKLQPYTVNLYPDKFKEIKAKCDSLLDGSIYILYEEAYDPKCGISMDEGSIAFQV